MYEKKDFFKPNAIKSGVADYKNNTLLNLLNPQTKIPLLNNKLLRKNKV